MSDNGHAPKPEVAYDIDVMRPDPVIVRVLGEEVDVGFIPAGVTMKVQQIQDQMTELRGGRSAKELTADTDFRDKNIKLMTDAVELVIGSRSSITRERLENELSLAQLETLISAVFVNMYGPATAARTKELTAEIEKRAAEDPDAPLDTLDDEGEKGGRSHPKSGAEPSASAPGSSDKAPTTSSTT